MVKSPFVGHSASFPNLWLRLLRHTRRACRWDPVSTTESLLGWILGAETPNWTTASLSVIECSAFVHQTLIDTKVDIPRSKVTNRYHVLTADSLVQNAINLKIICYLKNLFFLAANITFGTSKMLSLPIVIGLRVAINYPLPAFATGREKPGAGLFRF